MAQLIDDPKWIHRMEQYFDFIDKDHSGFITIVDIQNWATGMDKLCNPTANEMVKLRANLYIFWGMIGLKPYVSMTKKQFLAGANDHGMNEIKRKKEGIPTVLERCNHSWFSVVDADKDNSIILSELQSVMSATGLNLEGAAAYFEHMDMDKNNQLSREEFIHAEHVFWYKAKGVK